LLAVSLLGSSVHAVTRAATASTPVSGLRGLVTLSPTRPVCIEGQPCTKPAAHVLVVFRRDGVVVRRVTTGARGWYKVLLRPGIYTVVAPRYVIGSGVTPRTVRVWKGRVARVDLEIDTGIQ
jgi:hypothetical protein